MIAPELEHLAVDITTLDELPGNPRKGDVDAVARSYAAFGQQKPIVVQRRGQKTVVIDGNHQLKAARQLGWDQIAVSPFKVKDTKTGRVRAGTVAEADAADVARHRTAPNRTRIQNGANHEHHHHPPRRARAPRPPTRRPCRADTRAGHRRPSARRRRQRGLTVAAVDTAALTAVVAEALAETGRTLDDLTATEAIEIADALRAVVAALPAPTARDKRLAADIDAAAGIVERRTGTG